MYEIYEYFPACRYDFACYILKHIPSAILLALYEYYLEVDWQFDLQLFFVTSYLSCIVFISAYYFSPYVLTRKLSRFVYQSTFHTVNKNKHWRCNIDAVRSNVVIYHVPNKPTSKLPIILSRKFWNNFERKFYIFGNTILRGDATAFTGLQSNTHHFQKKKVVKCVRPLPLVACADSEYK